MGYLIAVLFIITCVLLILIVLLQKGRGGGLGAALGGAGSAAFGTKVGDMMTWVTIVLTAMFLLLAIAGALYFRPPPVIAGEPTFQPDGSRAITEDIRVTIEPASDSDGDTIWYTTDGSKPSRNNGDQYRNAFVVSAGTTVKAIAYPQRGDPSKVVTATYRAPQPMRPMLDPMPNPQKPITGPTTVTITAGEKTDKVFYTTNGDEPTESSRPYTAPISVLPKMTLKVRAFAPNAEPSEIVEVTYGLQGLVTPPVTTQPAPKVPTTTTAPAPKVPTTTTAPTPTTTTAPAPVGVGQ
ncbi:MAG: preprotein translocase subunit SecG [Phycisphaerae bacterium]|jgi:protein translocase SecG subunit|nr:preprotein translocase subunit SecG [Phycisphaerae bacterium]